MSGPLFNPLFSAWLGTPPVDMERVMKAGSGRAHHSSPLYLVGWKPVHVSARLAFERVEQRYAAGRPGAGDFTDEFMDELVNEFRAELLGYVELRRSASDAARRMKGGARP
jgi:hypothetical protein